MISSISSQSSHTHQIVTFVTNFSYLHMKSGCYFIIKFDYMVILAVHTKFYKNTTQNDGGNFGIQTRNLPPCEEHRYVLHYQGITYFLRHILII